MKGARKKVAAPRRQPEKGKGTPRRAERYAPSRRLADVRALLNTGEGASVYDIAERFDVSVRTAIRYIRALQISGEPLYEEVAGRRKVWRLMPSARQCGSHLTRAALWPSSPVCGRAGHRCARRRRDNNSGQYGDEAALRTCFGPL